MFYLFFIYLRLIRLRTDYKKSSPGVCLKLTSTIAIAESDQHLLFIHNLKGG